MRRLKWTGRLGRGARKWAAALLAVAAGWALSACNDEVYENAGRFHEIPAPMGGSAGVGNFTEAE